MFLLVSGRHVGAHPDGHQHGVSIQISINLDKKFLRISCIRKNTVTWNLARVFAYLSSSFSENLDFICWMVLIFILNDVTLKTSNYWMLIGWDRGYFFLNHPGTFGNQEGMIAWCWLAERAGIKLVSSIKWILKRNFRNTSLLSLT